MAGGSEAPPRLGLGRRGFRVRLIAVLAWDSLPAMVATPSELAKVRDDAAETKLTAADLRLAEGSWLSPEAPRMRRGGPKALRSLVSAGPDMAVVDPDPHPFADHFAAVDARRTDPELPRRLAHRAGEPRPARIIFELDAIFDPVVGDGAAGDQSPAFRARWAANIRRPRCRSAAATIRRHRGSGRWARGRPPRNRRRCCPLRIPPRPWAGCRCRRRHIPPGSARSCRACAGS